VRGDITSSSSIDKIDEVSLNVNQIAVNLKGTVFKEIGFRTKLKLTSDEDPLFQPRIYMVLV
jgi:hypothetical protein